MLTKWRLNRFKSFDSEELSFSRLTLLCGANSSGKSSILQSILLIKQTILYAPRGRAIALNGPLVRLGAFSDIENFQTRATQKERAVAIGWEMDIEPGPVRVLQQGIVTRSLIENLEVMFSFDTNDRTADPSTQEIQPSLRSSSIHANYHDVEGTSHELALKVHRKSRGGRKPDYDSLLMDDSIEPFTLFVAEIDDETKARALEGRPDSTIVGCLPSNFFPQNILIRYDRNKEIAKLLIQGLLGPRSIRRRSALLNATLPTEVADIFSECLRQERFSDQQFEEIEGQLLPKSNANDTLNDLIERVYSLPPSIRRPIQHSVEAVSSRLAAATVKALGRNLTISPTRVDMLFDVIRSSAEFFQFSLSYLGPLRDDPKPSYPLQALQSPTDVGPKGELTAAVLHLNEKRLIDYIPSIQAENNSFSTAFKRTSLGTAVQDWLQYIGVATEFQTSERGKFGHELRVRTSASGELQDLTNVGVGVSQVLPIIVTCLLAERGATIILEQPELHLNPAVQARLADFFISMSFLKKQCLIETHSEHIIERIRYRVVSDDTDAIRQSTQIYFVEQNKGISHCRPVSLTEYGAIEDWPENFFDQSQRESERIVMKALQRRRAKRATPVGETRS